MNELFDHIFGKNDIMYHFWNADGKCDLISNLALGRKSVSNFKLEGMLVSEAIGLKKNNNSFRSDVGPYSLYLFAVAFFYRIPIKSIIPNNFIN